MRRALCLLLCLVAGSGQLSITKFDVPTAVHAGKNAELQCQYTLEADETEDMLIVKWWWTPLDSDLDKKKQLYQRINRLKPELSSEHNHTVNHIEIKENDSIALLNLEPLHSGTYECEVSASTGLSEDRRHEELIVYSEGSGPQLNLSFIPDAGNDTDDDTEDDMVVICEASNVAPEPELSITISSDPMERLNITESISKLNDGLYNIQANTVLSQAKAERAEISCRMSFKKNISYPVYEDTQLYLGTETPSDLTSEEPPLEGTNSSSRTLPNSPDSSCHLSSSLLLLIACAFATHLKTILCTT